MVLRAQPELRAKLDPLVLRAQLVLKVMPVAVALMASRAQPALLDLKAPLELMAQQAQQVLLVQATTQSALIHHSIHKAEISGLRKTLASCIPM
jgi:hypothetical protein